MVSINFEISDKNLHKAIKSTSVMMMCRKIQVRNPTLFLYILDYDILHPPIET